MHSYVNNILVPYLDNARSELHLPPDQLAIWQIDAWSVHRSVEFRKWMKRYHPTIQLEYVPGGCTGLWQACDVGIQRLLKHEIRRSSRADIIEEAVARIGATDSEDDVSAIILDKSVKVVRDRSVGWLVRGYNAINKKDFVLSVSFLSSLSLHDHIDSVMIGI
ncbi:hypothetical protein FA95DRAFT_1497729 [Auriscalpium vulgare]|uniref:Uncharacterized protein n=1 Tax=Auriscalpium vulgare TaxID=40419 RepID=A0ACB8RJD3_9AGAM|nr:hypothetical protein FA95DRAFT_1497729 [Auriscalpium vulgare]